MDLFLYKNDRWSFVNENNCKILPESRFNGSSFIALLVDPELMPRGYKNYFEISKLCLKEKGIDISDNKIVEKFLEKEFTLEKLCQFNMQAIHRTASIAEEEYICPNREDDKFNPIKDAIRSFKSGNFVIVVDHEDRENEGDLIIAAEDIDAEKISFMIRYTSGIICTPLTPEIAKSLQLPLMVENNEEAHGTAFTVSVDARHGISTGVSALDRARTINLIASKLTLPADLVRPGHIFPLIAHPGGLQARQGHTEASIALCELANKYPVAVISEITKENGHMARKNDLIKFAKSNGICITSVNEIKKHMGFA